MFNINTTELGETNIYCQTHNHWIPLDPANRHYQEVLDAIILEGADCFDGDIPAELQAAADAKLFNKQLSAYTTATARLAQYILADGRVEVTEMQATLEQVWNEETMEFDAVMAEVVTVSAIEPVEPTVEVTTYDMETETSTTETVTNPLIVTDTAERATAQAIVDATPQAVINQYESL